MSQRLVKSSEYFLSEPSLVCTYATFRMFREQPIVFLADSEGRVEALSKPGSPFARLGTNSGQGDVASLEFLEESSQVLVGYSRGPITLFDLQTGRAVETFSKHGAGVSALRNCRRGVFASGSEDTTVRLWDIRQRSEAQTLKGHSAGVSCLDLSPDDQWLASGGLDGSVRLWDLAAAKALVVLSPAEQKPLYSLAFNPEEIQLACGGAGRKATFFDLEGFRETGGSGPVPGSISLVAFDSAGARLFVAGTGFLRAVSATRPSEAETLEAPWKSPARIFTGERGEFLAMGRQSNGAVFYKLGGAELRDTPLARPEAPSDAELEEVQASRKQHGRILEILEKKAAELSAFVGLWLVQKDLRAALVAADRMTDAKVVTDVLNLIVQNKLIDNMSIDFTNIFLAKVPALLEVKYKFYIKVAMMFSLEAVKKVGPELRNLKSVSLSKPDIAREERLKKYEQFLSLIESITKNSIFVKMRSQYRTEEIGQLASSLLLEFDQLDPPSLNLAK